MPNKLVIANWKMHGDTQLITNLIQEILIDLPKDANCKCVILPPSIYIPKVSELIQDSPLKIGGQNFYPQEKGAFTGEISAEMLCDFSCEYVLIGHSERRHIFNESDDFIAKKFHYAQAINLTPILCIGETLKEREQGLTLEVITNQLNAILQNKGKEVFNNSIIAYEPVWAIGTGQTATPLQAQEVHAFIRNFISSNTTPILYGGSVTDENAHDLFSCKDIDGGLIGGASLDPAKFIKIIKSRVY